MTITAHASTTGVRAPRTRADLKAWNREFSRLARLLGNAPEGGGSYYSRLVADPNGWAWVTFVRDNVRDEGCAPSDALIEEVRNLLELMDVDDDVWTTELTRVLDLLEVP